MGRCAAHHWRALAVVAASLAVAVGPADAAPGVRRLPARAADDLPVGAVVSVTPNGRWVAYSKGLTRSGQTVADIFVLDRSNGRSRPVTFDEVGRPLPYGVDDGATQPFRALSDDGRYVVFAGYAATPDGRADYAVYLRDLARGRTVRVDRAPLAGAALTGAALAGAPRRGVRAAEWSAAAVSGDGSTVAFFGDCTTEDPDDYRCVLYRYDVRTRRLHVVVRDADGFSHPPVLSRDGRVVAFATGATLDPADPRPSRCDRDVYVADSARRTVTVVSGGVPWSGVGDPCATTSLWLLRPALDATGQRVLFHALAVNRGGGGVQNEGLWLHDRSTGRTHRVDAGPGQVAHEAQGYGDLSADGRWAVYWSWWGWATGDPAGTTRPYAVWRADVTTGAHERLDPQDTAHPCTARTCWSRTDLFDLMRSAPGGVLTYPYPAVSGDGRTVVWPDVRRLGPDDTDPRADLYAWTG